MNMTEKNGQPSMEEILASIRRIIAEEPGAHPHNGELRGTPIMLKGDGVLDDAGDFDLPAIFRSSPPAQSERPTPLLGRLTDAIRGATSAQPDSRGANGDEYALADAVEGGALHSSNGHNGYNGHNGLSSLKPAQPLGPVETVRPLNGTSYALEQQPHAIPATASGSSSSDEPKRVMAAFKDTHFMRMSSPVAALPSPAPVVEVPVAALPSPAPVVEVPVAVPVAPPAPYTGPLDFGTIVPAKLERPGHFDGPVTAPPPHSAGERSDIPSVAPVSATAAPPAVIAMPPPPPLSSVEAHVSDPVTATSAGAEGTETIEDTTADLLRPMLRQWLADNMPRMVEKALHIEIAESVKTPKKP